MSGQSKSKLLFKLLVLGESGVGKTSLLLRYVENKFSLKTKSTIGASFLTKRVELENDVAVSLQIWDTAGQERFQGLGTSFYRGADGVLFVFDVTNRGTFEALELWRNSFLIQISQDNNLEFPIVVLANKVDLESSRVVFDEEIRVWCSKYNVRYFETSAKDNLNVEEAFKLVTKLVVDRSSHDEVKYEPEVLKLDKTNTTTQEQGCC